MYKDGANVHHDVVKAEDAFSVSIMEAILQR